MPRTFENAVRERAEERGEEIPSFERGEWFPEVSGELDGDLLAERFADIVDILRAVPGEGPVVPAPDVPDRVGAPDLEGLNETGLLQVIAQTLIEQLNVQIDVANAVEPPTAITVSGTNAIDQAEEAELVVPQSDSSNIPTRTLFIRNDINNSSSIFFGDDEVQPQDGFVLVVGEWISIPFDLRQNQLWMASEEADQVVQLLGVF